MKAQWIKVKNLKAGAKICITDNGINPSKIMFDEILEIKHVGREQVYDIEVEGTHNFVGNGIIAHNTYISGNVGIGTTNPTAQLELSGSSAIKASGTTWDNPSDVRLKNILGNYSKGLAEILEVNPVKYSFKENNALGLPQDGEHIGIIAQDIEGIFPEAVKVGASGYLTFQADPLIWASVNAIKELSNQSSAVSLQLSELTNTPGVKLAALEERVKSLETVIASGTKQSTSSAEIATPAFGEARNDVVSLPDDLIASDSASLTNTSGVGLSDATISGKLTSYDLSVQNNFKSLGETFLGNTTVAGNFSVDGTMSISGDSLNSLACTNSPPDALTNTLDCGILYLQNSPLAQSIDIFNGQVTIDKTGKLVVQEIIAKTITTEKLIIKNTPGVSPGSPGVEDSIGKATIPAGKLDITINTQALTKNSKVFLTPNSPAVLGVTKKIPEDSFTVELDKIRGTDLEFDWWVVN